MNSNNHHNNNSHHQHEAWHYQDGNVAMQYQQSSSSVPSAPFAPSMPSLPEFPPSAPVVMQQYGINDMHQQMHIAAMAHHQSAMQHHLFVQQNLRSTMARMTSAQQPPSLSPRQPHTFVGSTATPTLPLQTQTGHPWVTPMSGGVDDSSDEVTDDSESDSDSGTPGDVSEHNGFRKLQQMTQLERQQQATLTSVIEEKLASDRTRNAEDRRVLEQRYLSDRRNIQRQGASLDARLRKLEELETTNRAERVARDGQMQKLREENAWLTQQQQHRSAEKHRQKLADLAQSPRSQPQHAASAFDGKVLNQFRSEGSVSSPSPPIGKGKQKAMVGPSSLVISEHDGTSQPSNALIRGEKPSNTSRRAKLASPDAHVLDLQRTTLEDAFPVTAEERSPHRRKPSMMITNAAELQQTGNAISRALEDGKGQSTSSNFERALVRIAKLDSTSSRPVAHSPSSERSRHNERALIKSSNYEPYSRAVTDPALLRKDRHSSLPDDFPDNASQISSWDRGRAGRKRHRSVARSNAVPRIQTVTNTTAGQDLVLRSRAKKSDLKSR